jgi:DNA polymerase-3 subunit alpha
MGLQEFYDKCGTEEKQRLRFPKAVLLVAPAEDTPFGDYVSALHLDKAEVATTWTKPGVDTFLEVCAAEPAFVLQCGVRFSRKFPFADSPQAIDDALRARAAAALPDAFVNLHHHDEFSIKDGLGRVEKLCELLQAQRRSFCCVTNHGSVGGWIRQYKACKEAGLKAVFGMEAYVGKYRGDDIEKRKEDRSANHLVMFAMNREGFDNLIRIHNDAQLEGFYYVPRTNWEAAAKWGKGIVATSACMKGEIAEALMADDQDGAQRAYEAYAKAFDQFYVELQIIEFEEQREANRRLIKFAERMKAPMVLACDSHYLDAQHTATHDLLLLMRQGKTVYDKKDNEEEVWNFQVANLYYRDAAAMRDVFENGFTDRKGDGHGPFKDDVFTEEVFAEAMANTRRVAVQAEHVKLDSSIRLPKLYDNSREIMRRRVNSGFRRRKLGTRPDVQVYLDRVRHEYGVINKLGWTDYFLIMDRIVTDVKEKYGEWAIGYGRGSAAGSLVSYCLGLTDCDPIEHKLLFERFLDEGRPDPPDIDTDFDPRVREWVKEHIIEVFGADNVCSIGTYSTYKTRAVILNVARALALDVMEANEVTKKLEPLRAFDVGEGEEEIVDKMDLDDVCAHYPELAAYLEKNPEVRYHAEIIRNQVSNMSKHAAGVIISDCSLKGRIPVLKDSSGGILSAWAESGTVQELSEVGLVKYDILGLNNLPIISDCIDFIEKRQGIRLRREDIPIDDHVAIRQEARGDLMGIFQFENPATMPIVKEVGMESLADVAAITSLLRPGPKDMGMDMEYAKRKHGQPYEVLDCIRHILEPTYGIIVYQEQMMKISQALCGFDGPKANKLRKACGKKKIDLMKSIRVDFVKGAQPRVDAGEVTLKQVEDMWELIVKFAGYGFNLSHAITYSAITTVELWLKHNYFIEYMTALCNNTPQGKKRHGYENILVAYLNYVRRRGLDVFPPDVSASGEGFRIQGTAIRFSLGHVKNVATAAEVIEKAQPFASIEDFHERVKATVTTKTGKVREQRLNKKVFESLLYAGAFDKFGTRNEVSAEYCRLRKKKDEEPIELSDTEWLDKEREVIGMVLSVEPLVKRCVALVQASGAHMIGDEAVKKNVRLFGRIASMTPHTSRNGNSMFKVILEDGIDSIMFFVFEGGKQRFKDEFETGDVALVPLGRFDDGGQRFFDDNGPCRVFTKEELEDAEKGRLPQDQDQDAG